MRGDRGSSISFRAAVIGGYNACKKRPRKTAKDAVADGPLLACCCMNPEAPWPMELRIRATDDTRQEGLNSAIMA